MHLSEMFVDIIAYVVYFLKTASKRQSPYDQVRAQDPAAPDRKPAQGSPTSLPKIMTRRVSPSVPG